MVSRLAITPPPSIGRNLAGLAVILLTVAGAQAGPLEELQSLSQLPPLDLARLKSGEIVTRRGTDGDFARGISMESCYFIPAPVAAVGAKLLHWDPTKHPELGTSRYREYATASADAAFQNLGLAAGAAADRWLLDRTFAIAHGRPARALHLTPSEIERLRKGVPPKNTTSLQARAAWANTVWGEILRRRSDSLARGGISAVAPYDGDASISPGSEFRGLLALQRAAAKHFRPILGTRPLRENASEVADETVNYLEAVEVRGHSTLQLGVFAARKSAASWQLIDCIYYPSDTYFMALDLYQLWPVDGGTLVWQVSFVSAPFRAYLGGIDRLIAGKQMTTETAQTVRAFRADFARRP